mmetsp:Transcript_20180/g.43766  ORF Transcript_20180/g.43766 Transcript_20180/m.43766 type:complete len:240 (+) Transcript_20180:957-1676(+)
MVRERQSDADTVLLEVSQSVLHLGSHLLEFVGIVGGGPAIFAASNEVAMTRGRTGILAFDETSLIKARSRRQSLTIIQDLDENGIVRIARIGKGGSQSERHLARLADLPHRILEEVRQHPEQRCPIRVGGPGPSVPHEVEPNGNAVVAPRQPQGVEAQFLDGFQPRLAQVDRFRLGAQGRPLVEAREVGYVGDHPRGGGHGLGGLFEELAVLFPLVDVVDIVFELESIAYDLAGTSERV